MSVIAIHFVLAQFVFDAWDIGLSIGLAVTVASLVVAIFSQSGEVEISAQRQVALATGQTDRRTIFENPLLRPLVWLPLVAAHRLAMPRAKAWLTRTLVAAGSPNYYTAHEYLALALFTGGALATVGCAFFFIITGQISLFTVVFGMMLGVFLTIYQLHATASKRLALIARRVPYSLDLLALAMGAGATFSEAARTVVQEDSADPFNVELKAALAEIELGTTRRRALENLSARVPLDSLHSIIASVVQAEELGTPLHDVLHSEATLMRLHRSVKAENTAAVASIRIMIPGLLILMSVILTVFAPFIVKAITGGGLF